jgi:hypothetical protein
MKSLRRGGIAALLLWGVIATVGISTPVLAEESRESIALSPVSKSYNKAAGDVYRDSLTIINDGTVGYDFLMYGRPYSVQDSTYNPNFTQTPSNADVYRWVQFDQTLYHLDPGQSATVDYTVRIPASAAPGGHYGVLFAETQPSDTTGDSVVRKKRVGTILYATVKGHYQLAGEVVGASIPFLQNRPPLIADTSVKNTGNADFIDTVTHTVSDIFGNQKHQAQKDYPVLPQTTRNIGLAWDGAPWVGFYKTTVQHAYLDKMISTDGYVLILPLWLMMTLGAGLIGGILYAGIHYRKKRS